MSGLPDIGTMCAQVGYSRLALGPSRSMRPPPSFETLAEFIIGPAEGRTRWLAPQDDAGGQVKLRLCESTRTTDRLP